MTDQAEPTMPDQAPAKPEPTMPDQAPAKPKPELIEGVTHPFFETGTEGVYWAVQDRRHIREVDGEPRWSYDGLNILGDGDHLTVYGEDGAVVWDGVVALEYERCRQPFPFNPKHSQQAVGGLWVHGLQRDLDPEVWAKLFYTEHTARLRPAKPGR